MKKNLKINKLFDSSNKQEKEESPLHWRTYIAFYILALCNNLGCGIMLTAAHDILHDPSNSTDNQHELNHTDFTIRDCNMVSAGAVVIASSLPSFFIKFLVAFLPFYVNVRVALVVLLNVASFVLVAFSSAIWVALSGVVLVALATGLGEVTFLSYITIYNKRIVSTWAAGRGASGLSGSFILAGLTTIGMSPRMVILSMIIIPAIMSISFWIILNKPKNNSTDATLTNVEVYTVEGSQQTVVGSKDNVEMAPENKSQSQLILKIKTVPEAMKYILPMGFVYFFQFFINQGLSELVEFDNIWLDHSAQYRWIQVAYRIGFFVSMSSGEIINVNKLWLLVFLQFLNVAVFTSEVLLYFIPSIWIIFSVTLWEGIVAGITYVNIYKLINSEVLSEKKDVTIGLTSMSCSLGVTLAGVLAMPVYNTICQLPKPERLYVL